MKLKSTFLLAAALCVAPFASAQLTLHNFTAFESPATTVFVGDWAANGDPISGDSSPIASFSQGAGFYNFTGGTNADTSGSFYFYTSNPGSLVGYSQLGISARLLAGNSASTFTVSLFDSLGESAFAVFSTSAFAGAGFTTVNTALTFSAGFDFTDLASFEISGGVLGGTSALNISIDNLVASAPVSTSGAVPEPSTYGLLGGAALIALIGARRFRRR